MGGGKNDNIKCWFVMTGRQLDKLTGKRKSTVIEKVEKFNADNDSDVEVFAPTFIAIHGKDGSPRRMKLPLVGQYVFLRTSKNTLMEFRTQNLEFNPVIDKSSGDGLKKYLIVRDKDMDNFKLIASVYSHQMPCFTIDEIELEKNDLVRVVGGDFNGVEGRLVCQQGAGGGRVAISLGIGLAVTTLYVEPKYIQILEFAKGGRHIYDKMDAFVPRLRTAIREVGTVGSLTIPTTASLDFFVSRFSCADIPDGKLKCKFAAAMMMSHYLLKDSLNYEKSKIECLDLLKYTTNKATLAMIHGWLYFCTRDREYLDTACKTFNLLANAKSLSKSQQALSDDLTFLRDMIKNNDIK